MVRPTGPALAAPKDNFLRGSKASSNSNPTAEFAFENIPRPENKGFAAEVPIRPKNFWADPTGYGQPLYDNYLSKILPSKERLDNSSFSYFNLLNPRNTFEPKMIPGIIGSAVPGGAAFNLAGEAIKESGYGDTISQYGPLAALGVTAAKMFGNRNNPVAMARDLMPLFKSAVTSQVVGGLNDMTGWNWNAAVPAIYPKANLGFVNPQYASPANAGSYSQWLTDPRVTQNSPKLLPAPRIDPSIPLLPKPKLKPGSGNITEFFDKNPFNLELNPWNVINPNLTDPRGDEPAKIVPEDDNWAIDPRSEGWFPEPSEEDWNNPGAPKPDLTNWFPPGWEPGQGFQFGGENDYFSYEDRDRGEDDYSDYFTSVPTAYGPNQDQSKDWGPSFDEQIRNPSYDETDPENPYLNYEIQHLDTHLGNTEDPISYTDSLGNEWANRREYEDFIDSLGRTRQNDRATWEEERDKASYDLFMSQVEHWNPKWGPINNTPYQWMNNNPEPFDSQKMITHPKSSLGNIETGKPHDYNKYDGTFTMHEGAVPGDVRMSSGFEKEGDKEHPMMAWGRLSVDDKLMVYNALNSGGNEPSSLRFLPEHIKSAIRTSFGERGIGNQSSIHSYAENRILPPLSQMNQPNWEEDFRRVHAITRGIFLNNEIKMGQDTPDWADPKFKPGRPIP